MLNQEFINAGRIAVAFDLNLKELMQLVDAVGAQFAYPPHLGHMAFSIFVPEGEPYSWEKSIACATAFIQKKRFEIFEDIEFWGDVKNHFGLGDDDSIIDYIAHAECTLRSFSNSSKEEKIKLHASTLEFIFLESSLVKKFDSIRYLYKCGYILKKEVKGISNHIVSKALEENQNNISCFEANQQDILLPANAMPQGGSRPETDKITATREACANVVTAIESGHHIDKKGKIGVTEFVNFVRDAMTANNTIAMYQQTAAKSFFNSSDKLTPFKRRRGEKR